MILPFDNKIINDSPILTPEDFQYCNFIGYLSPTGEPIDYSKPFGLGGHDKNFSTELFNEYMFLQINNPRKYDDFYTENSYEKIEKEITLNRREYLKNVVIKMLREDWTKHGRSHDKYETLDEDLYLFFNNCYANEYFSVGFNGDNFIMSEQEFFEKVFKPIDEKRKLLYPRDLEESQDNCYWDRVPPYYQFESQYELYERKRILEILKNVMTSYLGYHYVARTPRTIYSSNMKIYETFYNYLLNDFTIIRLPKMIYNTKTKQYEKNEANEFLVPDSELRLKAEIETIRKRFPREERTKFYR